MTHIGEERTLQFVRPLSIHLLLLQLMLYRDKVCDIRADAEIIRHLIITVPYGHTVDYIISPDFPVLIDSRPVFQLERFHHSVLHFSDMFHSGGIILRAASSAILLTRKFRILLVTIDITIESVLLDLIYPRDCVTHRQHIVHSLLIFLHSVVRVHLLGDILVCADNLSHLAVFISYDRYFLLYIAPVFVLVFAHSHTDSLFRQYTVFGVHHGFTQHESVLRMIFQ